MCHDTRQAVKEAQHELSCSKLTRSVKPGLELCAQVHPGEDLQGPEKACDTGDAVLVVTQLDRSTHEGESADLRANIQEAWGGMVAGFYGLGCASGGPQLLWRARCMPGAM
jgi:hypothetical protein